MRRKGELSAASIDHDWPHQVVIPARLCERDGYNEIHEFCRDLTLCSRDHSLHHDGQWFHVYCFEELVDAQKFKERFGGETFNSVERGRGAPIGRGGIKATRMRQTLFRQVFYGVKKFVSSW
jgi:hypothetical protein